MAREHARILTRIWRGDDDWRALDWEAQHMYFLLLSQPTLSHAGTMTLALRRWAGMTNGRTAEDVEKTIRSLEDARYVVVDWDTDEILIRTFIRNDGVYRQPNVLKSAVRVVEEEVESARIKAAVAVELRRLGLDHYAARLDPSGNPSPNPSNDPPSNPADTNPSDKGSPKGSQGVTRESRGKGEGRVVTSSCESTEVGSKASAAADGDSGQPQQPPRQQPQPPAIRRLDVEQLCTHLADRIEGNTAKRPTITDRWRDAARLLLDIDLAGEPDPLGKAIRLADWATNHEFWRTNVLSMRKFREQFTKLRMQANREWEQTHRGAGGPQQPSVQGTASQRAQAFLDLRKGTPA